MMIRFIDGCCSIEGGGHVVLPKLNALPFVMSSAAAVPLPKGGTPELRPGIFLMTCLFMCDGDCFHDPPEPYRGIQCSQVKYNTLLAVCTLEEMMK